jgi:hypothetical protein
LYEIRADRAIRDPRQEVKNENGTTSSPLKHVGRSNINTAETGWGNKKSDCGLLAF